MFPKNRGKTPKSSILIGFSLINHAFWGFSPYFWKHPYGDQVYSFGMVILEVLTAIPPAMADNTKPGGGHLRLNPKQVDVVLRLFHVDQTATIAFACMYLQYSKVLCN